MRAILELLNLFSWRITFNFNKKNAYHTKFDFFMSILIIIISLILLIYFSLDMINKTNPLIIRNEKGFDIDKKITINEIIEKIEFYGEFKSEKKFKEKTIENNLFYYLIIIHNGDNDSYYFLSHDKIELFENPLQTLDRTFPYSYRYSGQSKLNNFKGCRKINDIKCNKLSDFIHNNENLTASLGEKTIIMSTIVTHNHENNFLEQNKNHTKIKLISNKPTFYVVDNFIDIEQKEKFFKISSPLSLNLNFEKKNTYTRFTFFYNAIKLIDTSGIIFAFEKEYVSYKKKYTYSTIGNLENNSQIYKLFRIRFEPLVKNYSLKYKKLQNVCAEFGGIFNSFLIIGSIIVNIFRLINFEYDMVNIIFGYDDDELKEYNKEEINNPERPKFFNVIRKSKINIDILKLKNNSNNQSNLDLLNSINELNEKNKNKKNEIDNELQEFKNNKNIELSNLENLKQENHQKSMNSIKEENKLDDILNKKESLQENNNQSDFIREENLINIKEREDKLKNKKENLFSNLIKNKFSSILNPKNIQLDKKIKEFLETKVEEKNKMLFNYSLYDLILIAFCRNCHKNKNLQNNQDIYKELSEKMIKNLDITTYYDLIENFHNIRSALLNENQNFSFDFLRNRDYKEVSNIEYEKKLENSYNYFFKKLDEGNLDNIDKFILKNFNRRYEKFLYD